MATEVTERAEGTEPVTRGRRGVAFYLGMVLILSGLVVLGYVGWQLYGTNFLARQAQERVVTELQEQWQAPAQDREPATSLEPATEPVEDDAAELGEASALIRIPRFGADYVMPVLEGIGDDELASGFGHFPRTADPGEVGNYALAAHRVTHGEPLRDMPKLRPGDEVIVETRDAVHTYELDTDPNALVVTFRDIWVVDPLPDNPVPGGVEPAQEPGQRLITLTTCAELFHTDDRMIAFGHLVDTRPK